MGHESWQSGPRCPSVLHSALGVANEMSSVRRAQSATRRWRTARASLDELGAGPNSSHACLGSRSRGSCRGRLPYLCTCLLLEKRRAGAWWTRMLFSESECNAALCSASARTLAALQSFCRRVSVAAIGAAVGRAIVDCAAVWPSHRLARLNASLPTTVPDMFRRRVGELNPVKKTYKW